MAIVIAASTACTARMSDKSERLGTGLSNADVSLLPSPREMERTIESKVLPRLRLEGKVATVAIDELSQLGFQCELVPETPDPVFPEKSLSSFVQCIRFLTDQSRIYGWIWASLHFDDWKGNGVSTAVRFAQLAATVVDGVLVNSFAHSDDRDTASARRESSKLDRSLVFASENQPLADVVEFAMTHRIACRTTISDVDHRTALECSMFKPSAGCGLAVVSVDVSPGEDLSVPLSIWSKDRVIKSKQGPWICIKAVSSL